LHKRARTQGVNGKKRKEVVEEKEKEKEKF